MQLDVFLDYEVKEPTDGIRFEKKGNTVKAIGPFFDSPYMSISEIKIAKQKLLERPEPKLVLKPLRDFFLNILEQQEKELENKC